MTIEALIDADLIAYRCAATCEDEPTSDIAISRCNDLIERILDRVSATDYRLYLTGSTNFRKEIDPQYKANRKDKPKPRWLNDCKEFMVLKWQAQVTDGIEADDALATAQHEDSFICSIDKDMLQVPGMHYNFVKDEEDYITSEQGLYNFWTQVVVGDTADNVYGVKGLGVKRTAPILDEVFYNYTEHSTGVSIEELNKLYYNCVAGLYNDTDRLHRNCKLLHLQRFDGDIWQDPIERETMVSTAPSLKKTVRRSSKVLNSKQNMNQIESNLSNPVQVETIPQIGK